MKARTGTEMRELDRKAIEYCGIPGIFLMEQAGKAVAFYAEQLAKPFSFPDFILLAGKGNNGGDVFVLARYMAEAHVRFRLCMSCAPDELSGDAFSSETAFAAGTFETEYQNSSPERRFFPGKRCD